MSTRLFVMLATTTGAFVALGAIARRTPIVSSGDDAGVNQTQPPASFRDAGLRVVDDQHDRWVPHVTLPRLSSVELAWDADPGATASPQR